jgi:hypothetical protein
MPLLLERQEGEACDPSHKAGPFQISDSTGQESAFTLFPVLKQLITCSSYTI